MAFDDLDAGEGHLCKPVGMMTPDELVSYVKYMVRDCFGFTLPTEGRPERAVFTWVKKVYAADAGNVVKWVFWKHSGKTSEGAPVSYFSWAKGRKWWVDRMFIELQEHRAAAAKSGSENVEEQALRARFGRLGKG